MAKQRIKIGKYYAILAPKGYKGKAYLGGRYVYEHRYLIEQKVGRLLKPGEQVHHKNHNRLDNRIENLELCSELKHKRTHGALRSRWVILRCFNCDRVFRRRRNQRPSIKGYKRAFCSRRCIGLWTAKNKK